METLRSRSALQRGEQLRSTNGAFVLTLQHDGNVVLVRVRGNEFWPLWSTTTGDVEAVWMQPDGNVVCARTNASASFTTNTGGHPGAFLQVRDDGNLVVWWDDPVNDRRLSLWQLGPAPAGPVAEHLSPGEGINRGGEALTNGIHQLRLQPDGNLVLRNTATGATEWSPDTHGKGGERLQYQTDGNLVLVTGTGTSVWQSETSGRRASVTTLSSNGTLTVGDRIIVAGDPTGEVDDTTKHPPEPEIIIITVTARVGRKRNAPDLTASEVTNLSVQRIDIVPNLSTAGHLISDATGASSPQLRHSFTIPDPATTSPAIQIAVWIGVPGRHSDIKIADVRADVHHAGDPSDQWRVNVGNGNLEIEIDVDYGPKPDGLTGWVLVPRVVPP